MGKRLKIGWGRRSIVPDRPVPITGMFYLRVSQGVFNEVTVNALVLENGEDAAIFVSADMVDLRNDLIDRVTRRLRAASPEIPCDKIVMNATHTHAGPQASANRIPEERELNCMTPEETMEFIAGRTAEAIIEAWNSRDFGSVAYGYGLATVGHSRRVIYHDDISLRPNAVSDPGISVNGHGKMYGKTDDPMFSHYEGGADPFVHMLYTFDPSGKLTGAVVNVPCPAQTNEDAWLLHAGYWHNVREKLRARHGDIGIIAQSSAAGDLSPRQLHGIAAETRRYRLKYPELFEKYSKDPPLKYPKGFVKDQAEEERRAKSTLLDLLRAEDIAERIAAAFEETLAWASKEKFDAPVLRHERRMVKAARRMFPDEIYRQAKTDYDEFMARPWMTEGDLWSRVRNNSMLASRRGRCRRVIESYEEQQREPAIETPVHAIRIGDAAFVTCRYELFVDFMHRIQARSPFVQTFIVELCAFTGPLAGP